MPTVRKGGVMQSPKESALDRIEALARIGDLHLRQRGDSIMLEWNGRGRTETVFGKASLAEAIFSLAKSISNKGQKCPFGET